MLDLDMLEDEKFHGRLLRGRRTAAPQLPPPARKRRQRERKALKHSGPLR